MRLEVRASSEERCNQCGATALLSIPNGSSREELAVDISAFIGEMIEDVEERLMRLFQDEQRERAAAIDTHEAQLEAALGSQAHFWRPIKRKWQRRLLQEVLRCTDELREQTSRA